MLYSRSSPGSTRCCRLCLYISNLCFFRRPDPTHSAQLPCASHLLSAMQRARKPFRSVFDAQPISNVLLVQRTCLLFSGTVTMYIYLLLYLLLLIPLADWLVRIHWCRIPQVGSNGKFLFHPRFFHPIPCTGHSRPYRVPQPAGRTLDQEKIQPLCRCICRSRGRRPMGKVGYDCKAISSPGWQGNCPRNQCWKD